MPRSRQLSTYLVAICLALAACGGDDGDDADPQPTTTSPDTTQSQQEEDEAALRQLAQDWNRAITEIYLGERPEDSAADFLAEPYLSEFKDQLAEFRESGNQIELTGRSDHQIVEVEVESDVGTVHECVVDADVLLDSEGDVLNDESEVNEYSTEATRQGEGWRFVGRRTISETPGTSCDS